MGKIHEQIQRVQLQFFALRYGEQEAYNLVALKRKARAKHLALLDAYGVKEAARREHEKLREAAHIAMVQRVEEESRLAAIEFLAASFRIEIEATQTEEERVVFRRKLALNQELIDGCKMRLAEARKAEQALAQKLEAQRPVENQELPHPGQESTPPRALPLDEARARAVANELSKRMHTATEHFYGKVFGRKQYKEIILLDTAGRLKAVQELDLAGVGKHKDTLQVYLGIASEAAVEGITAKNAISSMVDYVLAVVDDIPTDSADPDLQQKSEKGNRILKELEPLLADANRRVEEFKEVVCILESRIRDEVL